MRKNLFDCLVKNDATRPVRNIFGNFARLLMRGGNLIVVPLLGGLIFAAGVSLSFSQNTATPAGNAPGSPAGSYGLTEVENLSLFSGRVTANVPLVKIGGRGNDGYTMSFPLNDSRWTAFSVSPSPGYNQTYAAPRPELTPSGRTVYLQPFEYGIVTMRYTASTPTWPQPYPDGPLTSYQYAAANMVFTSADGTEHTLYDEKTGGWATQLMGQYPNYYWSPEVFRGLTFSAKDGSGLTFVSDQLPYGQEEYYAKILLEDYPSNSPGFQEDTVNGYLKSPDGTVVRFENSRAQWIRDRNGNKTTFVYEPNGAYLVRLDKVIDSSGRVTDIVYGTNTQITFSGVGGASRTITISNDSLQNRLRPNSGYAITTIGGLFPAYPAYSSYAFDNGNVTYNGAVPSTVTLPDGRSYNFYYNPYGELARIESPLGGAIEYEYGAGKPVNPSNQYLPTFASGLVGGLYHYGNQGTSGHVAIYRRLLERREYANGGTTPTLKTTFSRWGEITGVGVAEEQIDPATNSTLTRQYHYFHGDPTSGMLADSAQIGIGDQLEGRENKTENLDVNTNTVLLRNESLWSTGCLNSRTDCASLQSPWSPYIYRTITSIFEPGTGSYLMAKKEFTNDIYDNPTDTYEFDFGANQVGTTLKRRTHTEYVASSTYTSAAGPHIRNLPSQTWVSSDSAGNSKKALTIFEYDNYTPDSNHAALVSRSSVYGFDSANFGTGNTLRGNATAITRYSDAANSSGAVTGYSQYDILGNLVKVKDANGNVSTIGYADNFGAADSEATTNSPPSQLNGLSTFAFPTSTTNALSWTSYAQFDYFTNATVNTQNINGLVSKTVHNDPLDRPTQDVSAIGTSVASQSTIVYDDVNHKFQKTSDLNALNDNLLKTVTFYDGFGRTVQTRNYEADGNYVAIDTVPFLVVEDPETQIDRTATQVSNPYRPHLSEQVVWTKTLKDELGRGIKTIFPDGSIAKTQYDGIATTVTDQGLKTTRSIVDSLGNIVRVDEPNSSGQLGSLGSPVQPTYYTYDALGNMVQVSQGSQTRTFQYDSLSKLKEAASPEGGTVSQFYDGNGNMVREIDSRQIRTISEYDALNRVTKRCYTIPSPQGNPTTCNGITTQDTNQNTLPVTYLYDNVTNAKGKITKITTGSASSPLSVTDNETFDLLGRVTQSRQTTDGIAYNQMTYVYDLTGAVVEETYPSGRKVKNALANDGKLVQVQSKKTSNSGYLTYAKHFTYNSQGMVTSMQLGNGNWESSQYNSRQQATQIILTNRLGTANLFKLEYQYGELQGNGTVDTAKNNGNVAKQVITTPAVGATPGFRAVQTYAYDSLNRLGIAAENIENPNQQAVFSWRQQFAYDRYGNRTFDESNTTTLPKTCNNNTEVCPAVRKIKNPSISGSTNRIVLDQDGDSTNDYDFDSAGNMTRDAGQKTFTYNGSGKLIEVKNGSNQTLVKYFYDGDGKRVKTEVPNVETTVFIYNAAGKLVSEYSTRLAEKPVVSYLTNDALGSPRINTGSEGHVNSRHDYHPFGEEITIQRAAGLNYVPDSVRNGFTGYEKAPEIDSGSSFAAEYSFAQSRYYNASIGRFSCPDPTLLSITGHNPQTWNRYAYVVNNPLNYSDPLGLWVMVIGAVYQRDKDGKLKLGDDGNPIVDHYLISFNQTEKGDNGTVLAEQLGLEGEEAKKFAAEVDAYTNEGTESESEAFYPEDSKNYNVSSLFTFINNKLSGQARRDQKGMDSDSGANCGGTSCQLGLRDMSRSSLIQPADFQEILKTEFKPTTEDKLKFRDVVRYATNNGKNPKHFANFIFRTNEKVPMVFSKSGTTGPYELGPAQDLQNSKYGNISGYYTKR